MRQCFTEFQRVPSDCVINLCDESATTRSKRFSKAYRQYRFKDSIW